MSIFGIILALLGIVACVLVYFIRDEEEKYGYRKFLPIPLVALFVGFLLTAIVIVPVGNLGIVLRFGAVTGGSIHQGLSMKLPVDKVVLMNIRTQKFEAEATAASRDLQDVTTKIAINYRLDQSKATDVYATLGQEYIETIAHPAIQEIVKEITAKHDAEDLIRQRAIVKDEITQSLTSRLHERGIITEIVNITNFAFSEVFTKSIESKVAAAQSALEAENKLRQVQVEAQQAEAKAIGMANAAIAEADGKAKAITIVTEAQVRANQTIAGSLTPEILQYIFLDRLSGDIKIVVIPQGQNFVIPDIPSE